MRKWPWRSSTTSSAVSRRERVRTRRETQKVQYILTITSLRIPRRTVTIPCEFDSRAPDHLSCSTYAEILEVLKQLLKTGVLTSLRCLFAKNQRSVSEMAMFQQLTSGTNYSEIIPILFSHVSSNGGHPVIGIFVRRMPNPWPPRAYKCISTGTPAFFSA